MTEVILFEHWDLWDFPDRVNSILLFLDEEYSEEEYCNEEENAVLQASGEDAQLTCVYYPTMPPVSPEMGFSHQHSPAFAVANIPMDSRMYGSPVRPPDLGAMSPKDIPPRNPSPYCTRLPNPASAPTHEETPIKRLFPVGGVDSNISDGGNSVNEPAMMVVSSTTVITRSSSFSAMTSLANMTISVGYPPPPPPGAIPPGNLPDMMSRQSENTSGVTSVSQESFIHRHPDGSIIVPSPVQTNSLPPNPATPTNNPEPHMLPSSINHVPPSGPPPPGPAHPGNGVPVPPLNLIGNMPVPIPNRGGSLPGTPLDQAPGFPVGFSNPGFTPTGPGTPIKPSGAIPAVGQGSPYPGNPGTVPASPVTPVSVNGINSAVPPPAIYTSNMSKGALVSGVSGPPLWMGYPHLTRAAMVSNNGSCYSPPTVTNNSSPGPPSQPPTPTSATTSVTHTISNNCAGIMVSGCTTCGCNGHCGQQIPHPLAFQQFTFHPPQVPATQQQPRPQSPLWLPQGPVMPPRFPPMGLMPRTCTNISTAPSPIPNFHFAPMHPHFTMPAELGGATGNFPPLLPRATRSPVHDLSPLAGPPFVQAPPARLSYVPGGRSRNHYRGGDMRSGKSRKPLSCYNCGQGHYASECKEYTMEHVMVRGRHHNK